MENSFTRFNSEHRKFVLNIFHFNARNNINSNIFHHPFLVAADQPATNKECLFNFKFTKNISQHRNGERGKYKYKFRVILSNDERDISEVLLKRTIL